MKVGLVQPIVGSIGGNDKVLDSLLIALKAEREADNFYSRMAKRSKNPTGQEIFKHLVGEEKKHIKILEERLKKANLSADTSSLTEKASILSEVDFSDPHLSDMEIINVAIEDEKHAIDFYQKAAEETALPEDIAMYALLAKDEQGHLQNLEREAVRLTK